MSKFYTLVPAGPATVRDAKTKEDKTNTVTIPVPSVNPADYPHLPTASAKVKGEQKTIVSLEVPATDVFNPQFANLSDFQRQAEAAGADADAKATQAINDILASGAAALRRAVGRDAKTIPANVADMFTAVPDRTVEAFLKGVQRAQSAKATNEAAAGLLKSVDTNDPAALAAAVAQLKAMLGVA